MLIRVEHTYDAPPLKVYQMYTDQDFLKDLVSRANPSSYDVVSSDGHTRVHLEMPAPAQAAKFVSNIDATLTINWGAADADGARRGPFDISIKGVPASVDGEASIMGKGERTVVVFTGDLKIGIPFVGPKLEQTLAPKITSVLASGEEVGARWLTEHP